MLKKFLPYTTDFFEYFEKSCSLTIEAAKELKAMAEPGANIITRAARIKEIEHEADTVTHRCMLDLQKTFITPFDRSQIHALIKALDDVLDSTNDASSRIALYELHDVRPEVGGLADVILQAGLALADALKGMRNLKEEASIKNACIKVHRFENDADEILRNALKRLFQGNPDPILVIKWKEIFENLENATDRCEDVADIIHGVVLEAS